MAYEQHRIMGYVLKEMKELVEDFFARDGGVAVGFFDGFSEVQGPVCMITFLGFREEKRDNMMNRIQIRRSSKEGKMVEALVKPPLSMTVRTAVLMGGEGPGERLSHIGELLGFLREHDKIAPGDFDWAGNDGAPIVLRVSALEDDDRNLLPEPLQGLIPFGLLLEATVGVESSEAEEFTRVKERRLSAFTKENT
ncbi:hypothetical protein [Sediminispirochaeta bajacaliforniensis]|uniref:hypothetical protein n=1 Tax=Sediminispirochaeta bajacaliforniensis TaxID=148 RepID=UPI000363A09F|nr:hypothetical protein [Sediminispirochaeta bajacaliforniensis]